MPDQLPDKKRDGGWKGTLLGLVVILLLIAGSIYAIRVVYTQYFLADVVSLAAYFVDDSGVAVSIDALNYAKSHIRIKGDVSQGGQPPKNGSVRLTISSADNGLFRQSVHIPFENGHFETEDPAFRSVRPGERIEIKAEVTAPGLNETAMIYLNRKPPVESDTTMLRYLLLVLLVAVPVLGLVFVVTFTGRKTAFKNRVAIIFSYLIISVFLGVPIVAPTILIRTFPGAVSAMIGAPVGLVNTHTPDQPGDGTQWALNIGGYSFEAEAPAKPADAKPAEGSSNKKAERDTTAEESTATQVESPASAGVGTPGTPGSTSSSSNTTPALRPAPSPSGEAESTATSSPPQAAAVAHVVKVEGGLVIPLYVIILSVIGGAINMTRKVPGFQKEGEESDFSLARPIAMVGTAVINRIMSSIGSAGAASPPTTPGPVAPAPAAEAERTEASLEDQAQAIDAQLLPLVTTQLQRNGETDATLARIQTLVSKMQDIYKSRESDEPLLKFSSFEDWAASHPRLRELLRGGWRVELLSQYMYLISAPFLAIVTYYILDLLGLSKQGVVVVLSFSVGLISERIVSWILGIATGYLRTDGNATAKAA